MMTDEQQQDMDSNSNKGENSTGTSTGGGATAATNDTEYEDVNVWIGGSSGLARTFFVNYDILVGNDDDSGKDDDGEDDDDGQAKKSDTSFLPEKWIVTGIEQEQINKKKSHTSFLPEKWIVTGIEQEPPSWMIPFMMMKNNDNNDKEKESGSTKDRRDEQSPSASSSSSSSSSVILEYAWLDLTVVTEEIAHEFVTTFLRQRKKKRIVNVVVGVRPKLFDKYIFTSNPRKMVTGLHYLLREIMMVADNQVDDDDINQSDKEDHPLPFILHLSSVAAVDHLTSQHLVKEEDYDDDTASNDGNGGGCSSLPPLSTYRAPYDRFKRESEDIIAQICQHASNDDDRTSSPSSSLYCHLRLSAIFSDDEGCIQCNALGLQAYSGAEMPLAIDCNSSLNVAKAIHFLLMVAMAEKDQQQQSSKTSSSSAKQIMNHIYYYTRPLELSNPVPPYGYYLREYRKTLGIWTADSSSSTSKNVGKDSWIGYLSSKIFPVSIPVCLVVGFTQFVHLLAVWNRWVVSFFGRRGPSSKKMELDHSQKKNDGVDTVDSISRWREEDDRLAWKGVPYLDSIDYLLQVASREHSFDCRRFQKLVDVTAKTYPWLSSTFQEESIYECFMRRRKYLDDQEKLLSKKRIEYLKEHRRLEYERLRRRMMASQ